MKIKEEVVALLKEIQQQRKTQENFATRNPIYLVQKRRERIVDPEYDTVEIQRLYIPEISCEGFCPTFEDVKDGELRQTPLPCEFVMELEECENIEEMFEMFSKYFSEDDLYYNTRLTNAEYYWETMAYFLILKDAQEYQQYQKHNLGVSRIYADYVGYGNAGAFAKLIDIFDEEGIFEE